MEIIRHLAAEIEKLLGEAGIASPRAEARIICETVCGGRFFDLADRETTPEEDAEIRAVAARRQAHEPLQYILGEAPFRDLMLDVTPDVLIPRPETELLAGFFIGQLPAGSRFLDLGTGSGAIALAVASERPDVAVTAADFDEKALAVAVRNAKKCASESRVRFVHSDLFSALQGERFDGIAANLPYVTRGEYVSLDPEVRDFEPETALVSGDGGLRTIFRAIEGLDAHLAPGGAAVFEMSPTQTRKAANFLREKGFSAEILRDLAGRERFVAARGK